MKKILFIIFYFVTFNFNAQVGIGTNSPNSSSVLDLTSTTKGFLPPRMSNVEMNAINNPSEGLLVFCNDFSQKGIYLHSENNWLYLSVPDASNSTKGKIQLAGDLGGTADLPTVPELANKEIAANKSLNIITDASSDIKYPSVKAVKTYFDSATMQISDLSGINSLIGNWNKDSEVALLIESGQSNAESAAPLSSSLPVMNNVFGLDRASNYSVNLSDVTWSPFSADGMSLGFNYGTGKTSIATEFARLWQLHINSGNSLGLPNLYIIRIPWSGQGIGKNGDPNNARWNIVNTDLSTLTIENLAFFQQYLLQLVLNNITRTTGRSIRIIGNIWVHGEQDSKNLIDANNYQSGANLLFRSLDKICNTTVPIYFIYNRSNDKFNPGRFQYQDKINFSFKRLSEDRLGSFVIDPYQLSIATPEPTVNKSTQGIYLSDCVHFNSNAISELASKIYERIVVKGVRGPLVKNDMAPAKLNFFDNSSTNFTTQISTAQTTADNALATADAAIGFSTLYANTYLASSTTNIILPGYSQIDAGTGTSQVFAVSRDILNDKKYFNLPTWNSGGKFKFLLFNNFKSDTKYAGFQIRGKGLFSFGCLLRMVPNAIPANTFQSTGFNYVYVAIGSQASDSAYITSFTAGSGDGTPTSSADGTSAIANTPKVVIYAFDSKAPGSYRTLSVSSINTTTHPNFSSSGTSSEIDIKYAIEADGANGTIAIKYKNINESNWTTLYSYVIPSATTLGTELTSGGKAGFAFGIGNRFNAPAMQEIKISSLTPISLE